jgi:hypothetical protein
MNLIEKIKMLFTADENKEQTFIDAKTTEGKILRVDELQPEQKVQEVTEEGLIDVEPGTYILEGGIEVVVGEGSIITDVREVEEMEEEEEKEEELFTDLALKDGPIAHVISTKSGEINEGDKLVIDGMEAAPNEYPTTDGRVLMVGEGGVITEVKNAEETTEEEVVVEAEVADNEVVEEEVVVENEVVEEDPIQKLTEKIEELNAKLSALSLGFEKVEEENKELKKQVEEFSAAPSATPTRTTVDFKKADRAQKIDFFSKR